MRLEPSQQLAITYESLNNPVGRHTMHREETYWWASHVVKCRYFRRRDVNLR